MEPDKFCLKWNDYGSNIGASLRDLKDNNDFLDLTLACDDAQEIHVHRVILSACSSFFRNILRRLPHHHPYIYMRGIRVADLRSIVSFVYNGEVNVAQEDLNNFLSLAEDLKIRGLTQNHSIDEARLNHHQKIKTLTKPPSLSVQKTLQPNPVLPPPRPVSVPSTSNVISSNSINSVTIKTEVTNQDSDDHDDIAAADDSYQDSEGDQELSVAHTAPADNNISVFPVNFGVTDGNKGINEFLLQFSTELMCPISASIIQLPGHLDKHLQGKVHLKALVLSIFCLGFWYHCTPKLPRTIPRWANL